MMKKDADSSLSTIMIEKLAAIQFPLVARFYRDAKYKSKPGREDCVWVAKSEDQMIAAVRLCPQDGYWFLRSLVVAPVWRGKGIAQYLLARACARLDSHCWCFPYTYLQKLYEQNGFVVVPPEDSPAELRKRFEAYCRQGKELIIMCRHFPS